MSGKKDGMDRARRHADPYWLAAAHLAVFRAARQLPELTSDDVHARIPERLYTHELRALGPVMKAAAANGWIAKNGGTRISVRPENHERPLTLWRSLVYRGP
jgi:hypothetical protein